MKPGDLVRYAAYGFIPAPKEERVIDLARRLVVSIDSENKAAEKKARQLLVSAVRRLDDKTN